MTLDQAMFESVRRSLGTIPNLSVPASVAAAVARLSRGDLGVVYYETAVVQTDAPRAGEPGWEVGTHVRVHWISDAAFGTVTGHSPNAMWNGQVQIASEPEHQIDGRIEKLTRLEAVRFGATPDAWFDRNSNEFEIEASIMLEFSGGSSLAIGEYPIYLGGSHQRAALDTFTDAALDVVGH